MEFFFDLENCLIKDWDHLLDFTNDEVLKIFTERKIKKISIYSWAIGNETDKQIFNERLKSHLEKFLNVKIVEVVSKDDLIKVLKQKFPITESYDVNDFFGKRLSFFHFCQLSNIRNAVLFDDTVEDEIITSTLDGKLMTVELSKLVYSK
jgi:hypothetical protein